MFARISKEITIAQANLLVPPSAPAEIDRVLRTCYVESRPVYIALALDMMTEAVEANILDEPINISPHASDEDVENRAAQVLFEHLYAAQRPILLVDGGAQRRRVSTEAALVDAF